MRMLCFVTLCLVFLQEVTSSNPAWFLRHENCTAFVCCRGQSRLECRVSASEWCSGGTDPSSGRTLRIVCEPQISCAQVDPLRISRQLGLLEIDGCRIANKPFKTKLNPDVIYADNGVGNIEFAFLSNLKPSPADPKLKNKWPFLHIVRLSNAGLTSVPIQFLGAASQTLDRLDLSNNNLSIISAVQLVVLAQMGSVKEVILDNNEIIDFGQELVDEYQHGLRHVLREAISSFISQVNIPIDFTNLLKILTGINKKADITLRSFMNQDLGIKFSNHFKVRFIAHYDQQDLRVLRINYNKLKRIPDSIFGFHHLEELHLAYNKIASKAFTTTEQYVFKLMHNLKLLNLEGNQISALRADSFMYLEKLQKLYIGRNQLSFLPKQLFRMQAKHLTHLDLSNNKLSDFYIETNVTLSALKVLDIHGNSISYIGRQMLERMPQLQTLDASDNQIKAVGASAFSQLRSLRKVMIQGHHLTRVPAAAFETALRYSYAERVRLQLFDHRVSHFDSKLTCDCDSVFMATAVELKNIFVLNAFRYPKIERPLNANGKVCINILGRSLNFSEAMASTGNSDICSVKDLDCPDHCTCCKSNAMSCDCTFHCPTGCKCYRSHSWENVTIECEKVSMNYMPTMFTSPLSQTPERPLITQMTFSNANLLFIGVHNNYKSASCPRGLLALRHLEVVNSNLRELRGHPFECTPKLQSLSIVGNPLKVIPAALFSERSSQLIHVNFSGNAIMAVPASAFDQLRGLASLDLRGNPLLCDCSWETEFFRFESAARHKGLVLALPDSCKASDQLQPFTELPSGTVLRLSAPEHIRNACARMRAAHSELLRLHRLLFSTLPPAAFVLLFGIIAALVYRRHRYWLRLKIDDAVEWQLGRRLLGLHPQLDRPIDVALFFHESQAREQTEVSNFIQATGRGLIVEPVAYRMPGAFVSDQLSTLITDVAVCFVYITPDFLNDVNYMGPIRDFFEGVFNAPAIRLVPIYPNDGSLEAHDRIASIQPILRRYNGLQWGSSHFWERLSLALPPRRHNRTASPPAEAAVRNCKLADLCVVAHAEQLHLARAFFERYRGALSVVHFRNGALYNCPARPQPQSLLQACLWSRQVLLILSPGLVADMDDLYHSLGHRLSRFAFYGSLIVVEVGVSSVAFNPPERGAWPALIQEHDPAIWRLSATDLANEKWTEADKALGLSQPPHAEALGEEEFQRLFHENGLQIDTGDQDFAQFEVNRMDWDQEAEGGIHCNDRDPLI